MSETVKKGPVVVSILNLKGGVGKTTVAALLARYAGLRGYKEVLAVDLDPQANLSQALMGAWNYDAFMRDKKPSIVELFNKFIPASSASGAPTMPRPGEFLQKSEDWGIEIIPSRFDFSDNLIKSLHADDKVLAKFIAAEMGHKDLILIDCAPTESILTHTAYHASRHVLIPVRTDFFSTIGFPLMKESLDLFKAKNRGHEIDICGVLVNEYHTSGGQPAAKTERASQALHKYIDEYGWHVFRNRMNHSEGYHKMAQGELMRGNENAPHEWPQIADEIFARIGLGGGE